MEKPFLQHLVTKISLGTATDEELLLYQKWYEQQLLAEVNPAELEAAKSGVSAEVFLRLQAVLCDVEEVAPSKEETIVKTKSLWIRWWISAAAALLIMAGAYHFWDSQQPMQLLQQEYSQVNFDSTQGVILKLSNGEPIDLANISSDSIDRLTQGKAVKTADQLHYNLSQIKPESSLAQQPEVFNSLYTPAGKTFMLVLADGSKVWLNSKSMLRFPVNFVGPQRRVQLIGEGYFEVVSNAAKPFIVESKGQEVEVLGTKFNIDAYSDAPLTKSTLFEGKVSVTNLRTHQSMTLMPGDQALLSSTEFSKKQVLLKNVLGWKNGYFVFQNEKIDHVCTALSRWYNVDFDRSKNAKLMDQYFSGTVPQFENIDDLLAVLSETGTIKFKREGRRIILMN